jgi:hypothetical protein
MHLPAYGCKSLYFVQMKRSIYEPKVTCRWLSKLFGSTCCRTSLSASFFPSKTVALWFGHDIRSNGGQVVYSKDQEDELVSAILKLSACGFGILWDKVTNAAFSFTQSNRIKYCFSVNNKMAGFDRLKWFRHRFPAVTMRKARGTLLARSSFWIFFSLLEPTDGETACDEQTRTHISLLHEKLTSPVLSST